METFIKEATPARVIDIAPYDAEKPNHKVMMKNDNGAVILVILKKGQRLDTHLAPDDVMVYSAQGEVEFTVDGEEKRMFEGDCMFMHKGTPHSVHALTDTKIILTKIKA